MTAPLELAGDRLLILDQTLLPGQEVVLELRTADEVAAAILRLAVRGAPLIGVAAAYGLALEVASQPDVESLERGARALCAARPTAVNLAWAVDRVRAAALAAGADNLAAAALAEAVAIHTEDEAASRALAAHGADYLAGKQRILTVCNTGALAASGEGTALAVIAELARRSPHGEVSVLACETRPLLQGARLTVWELVNLGIPHALIADGAAAGLIARGEVDAVIAGCDRVAANGDTANKVGTYGLSLAAQAAGIPFVIAGPRSTIDPATPDGAGIEIEERGGDEVRYAGGALLTIADVPVRNPAFDVTPAALISALVTEAGVAAPPSRAAIADLLHATATPLSA
jgi:methylthioribose-1-phosphate isomerase